MAKAKKTAIADVAHPDTSAPSDTSKPIINQRPIMKDPMVVADEDKPEDKKQLPVKTAETKITPPKEAAKEDAKPASEETPEKPEESAEPEPNKKPSKPKVDNEAAAKTAQDAKVQQLIDSKKYALPINAVEHRRSKRVVVIGIILALVLIVAWVDIALDASLIDAGGVKPVTHFFSN